MKYALEIDLLIWNAGGVSRYVRRVWSQNNGYGSARLGTYERTHYQAGHAPKEEGNLGKHCPLCPCFHLSVLLTTVPLTWTGRRAQATR